MVEYAHCLRSIGQALERLNVDDFDMELEGESFLVRCSVPWPGAPKPEQPDQASLLRHIWGVLPHDSSLELSVRVTSRFKATDVDLQYTLKDVNRLDAEGKARRGERREEFHAPSLSQFLRAVGAYVGQKPARLVKLSRRGESISIQYEDSNGEKTDESLTVDDLYDLCTWMTRKRVAPRPV